VIPIGEKKRSLTKQRGKEERGKGFVEEKGKGKEMEGQTCFVGGGRKVLDLSQSE